MESFTIWTKNFHFDHGCEWRDASYFGQITHPHKNICAHSLKCVFCRCIPAIVVLNNVAHPRTTTDQGSEWRVYLSLLILILIQSSATPRLYQEIRERGLNSTNQDELLDDFVVVEPPVEDQGIVVKSYRPAQLTWSQLPQVTLQLLPWCLN